MTATLFSADPPRAEAEAAAALEKLGAKVTRSESLPGRWGALPRKEV